MSALVAGILIAVSAIVINRLETYFREQEERALTARALVIGQFVGIYVRTPAAILPGNIVAPDVAARLTDPDFLNFVTNTVARADLKLEIGGVTSSSTEPTILTTAANGTFDEALTATPEPREAREDLTASVLLKTPVSGIAEPWGVRVTLSDPYTTRAYTLETITGLLGATALGAMLAAVLLAAVIAGRFTRPLRRLTEAIRRLAAGDLSGRVPSSEIGTSYSEIQELAGQFNVMAARLEESVAIVRSDRDRSRDFLADVSHELRTPIAALRMFNELLREGAWRDDAAREEFLESNRVQLERLDWLSQNLLELSKLESGLLALDLRPEDLRTAVESAVEQAEPAAHRRGVAVAVRLPSQPLRVWHDPQRIGQVVGNLLGNAIKFTPRGGQVTVEVRPHRDGAQVAVQDTGVGIDAAELPRIFERFYRGSSANEARGSGSGLGLAIVKSIVDMHAGRISVESRVGSGSTFTVTLVRDPRTDTLAGIEPDAAGRAETGSLPMEAGSDGARGAALDVGPGAEAGPGAALGAALDAGPGAEAAPGAALGAALDAGPGAVPGDEPAEARSAIGAGPGQDAPMPGDADVAISS